MYKSPRYNPNMFDAHEAPALNRAFAIAWRVLTSQQADPEKDPSSIGLQSRIASAIIIAAGKGVTNPARMAKAAIEKCAPARALRLAS